MAFYVPVRVKKSAYEKTSIKSNQIHTQTRAISNDFYHKEKYKALIGKNEKSFRECIQRFCIFSHSHIYALNQTGGEQDIALFFNETEIGKY